MENQLPDLLRLFGQAVTRTPEALAVDHEDGTLSYRQLDQSSTALAHTLSLMGVRPKDIVPLLTVHGALNVIAILSILKTGACYVPLDRATSSAERIRHILESTGSSHIVNATLEKFTAPKQSILHLTDVPITHDVSPTKVCVSPDDLACIIYTSGSTGKPKGVMITHQAVANYAQCSPFNMDVQLGDRVLHILNVAFDGKSFV